MVKRKSPIDAFFSLGDKITGGDMVRKAQFDYYLMWIIFLGFLLILYVNLHSFIVTMNYKSLGWSLVIVAILWFQYGSMKMARMAHLMMKEQKNMDYNKVEDIDKMMEMTNPKSKTKKKTKSK